METTKILSANFLDILFDGRNKAYGAYELRITYNGRLLRSLVFTGLLVTAIACVLLFKTKGNDKVLMPKISEDLVIENIEAPEKVEPPAVQPPKQQEPKKIETAKFVVPKIVPDEKVITPPPSQNDLIDVKIGTEQVKGDKMGDIVVPPDGLDNRKGIIMVKTTENNDEPFIRVEKEAAYPGDWIRFLTTHLRGEIPVDNGAAPGNYQVIVQFVVDVAGNVSDIQVVKNPGFGMDAEAVRVIKKSGKWKPAIQNGRVVKAYRKQPITFQVLEQ
jgi:protein TonB